MCYDEILEKEPVVEHPKAHFCEIRREVVLFGGSDTHDANQWSRADQPSNCGLKAAQSSCSTAGLTAAFLPLRFFIWPLLYFLVLEVQKLRLWSSEE